MARRDRSLRKVDGILLLDKPVGASSNQAVQTVKRLYSAKKAGHTGSLDPLADGLLIVCLGEATKVSPYILASDKSYQTVCKLGIVTTTADGEGEITRTRPVERYTNRQIERALARFRGEIEQIPPMYSALKFEGKRLYSLARKGIVVQREPRKVQIYRLECVNRDAASLTLNIVCSKGTYIRVLVEDIGEMLGCGAYVNKLRRLAIGPYQEPEMVSLEQLSSVAEQGYEAIDLLLQPIDSALFDLTALKLSNDMTYYVKLGQAVLVAGSPSEGYVRLYDDRNMFVGIGVILDDGRVAPKKLILQEQ